MKDRTHDIRAHLVKELKWLRQHEGATWQRYSRTRLLGSLVGGDELDYAGRLKTVIATYATDGRQQYNTLICLNLEGTDTSGKVGVRRAAAALEQEINRSTVANDENTVFNQVAKGLVAEYPKEAAFYYETNVLQRNSAVVMPPEHDSPDAISIMRTLVEEQEAVVAAAQGRLEELKECLLALEATQTP